MLAVHSVSFNINRVGAISQTWLVSMDLLLHECDFAAAKTNLMMVETGHVRLLANEWGLFACITITALIRLTRANIISLN